MVTQQDSDPLSAIFGALADPTRRAILERLSRGQEVTVAELAAPFAISRPAISRHLRVLEAAGLIQRTVDRQWRRIRIDAGPLKNANDWLRTYRQFWEHSFDRLVRHLEETEPQENNDE